MIQQAEEDGWGPLTGTVVLGDQVVYTFGRRKVTRDMPAGSVYPGRGDTLVPVDLPMPDGFRAS